MNLFDIFEEKVRLDPKCWKGKKIGNPKTKVKGGVRVNNCVPVEEEWEDFEELVKKSEGINKKELVINLFKALFGLPEAEVKVLDASIEFLWSNGLIYKISSSKKAVRWLRKKAVCLL
jgi:hypothetical protein